MAMLQPSAAGPGDSPSPLAIRDALLPEDLEAFDAEYRLSMAEATESLDLNPLLAMLERWRRIAVSSQDADAHRRMLHQAEILAAGGEIPAVSLSDHRRHLGL